MSERTWNGAASPAWNLDTGARRPLVPGRLGGSVHGNPAGRTAGVGFGIRSDSGGRPGGSSGAAVGRRRGGRSPEWYRRVVFIASGASAIGLGAAVVIRVVG